jgi:sulfate adenylyltransferase
VNHDSPPPSFAPPLATLAEIELALLGSGRPTVRVVGPTKIGDDAAIQGLLVVTDHEGAPVTTIHQITVTATQDPDPDRGVVVSGVITPARMAADSSPGGPFERLRVGPREVQFAGAAAVVAHDPPDAHSLAAIDPERPVLFVVLDGPRLGAPGPPAQVVVPAALALRDEMRESGRSAYVVLVPAPRYDDERDAALARTVAEAYGAELAVTAQRPDAAALRAALDEGTTIPEDDWPAASALAWRRWRPPRATRGLVILFTGLSGSGKSTVARAVVDRLAEIGGRSVTLLDGDVVRRNLSAGLGFSRADRDRNVRRIGYVAAEIARHGGVAVCAPIAPFAATRAEVRNMAEEYGDFLLVHVSTPLEECERRDRKGLYARARAGEIPDFTGISSPYEIPDDADLVLDTSQMAISQARDRVLDFLAGGGWITR